MLKKIRKTYKFRIYPNEKQKQKLSVYFGNVRFVYNYFLNERKEQYAATGKSDNYYEQTKKLTLLKHQEEYSFLNQTAYVTLKTSLRNLETAYVRFFTKKSGLPKFHKKKSRQSFLSNQNLKFKEDKICFVGFKEGIQCEIHRQVAGKMKQLSIVKYPSGKYYVNISTEQEIEIIQHEFNEVGIDLGIKNLLITSDGDKYDNPKFINKYQKQLAKAQQHLSRKKKSSNSFENQRIKVAKIQEKIANCRQDNLHKITYLLTHKYSDIYLEDLNVKGMQQNHHLAKSVSDCSWYSFMNMLQYKGEWYRCKIHKINRWYPSSKTCSNCNFIIDSLPLNVRERDCPNCHTHHDRDINAAINILKEGKRELSAGIVDYTDGESARIRRPQKSTNQDSMKSEAFNFS